MKLAVRNALAFFAGFVLTLVGGSSWGEDVTVSWSNPTEIETCTPVGPYTDPAGTKIYQLIATVDDPVAETFVIQDVKVGDYTYVARAYSAAGNHSKLSSEADRTVATFVTTAAPVYTIFRQPGVLIPVPVGDVPLGTPCEVTQTFNGLYAVPQDNVVWRGSVESIVVFAQCG